MQGLSLLITALLLFFLYRWATNKFRRHAPSENKKARKARPRKAQPSPLSVHGANPPTIAGDGRFETEVVGESNYQAALKRIVGKHGNDEVDHECVAELVFEDTNPHDDKAIKITVNDEKVGYIPRGENVELRKRLNAASPGVMRFACNAAIFGGFKSPGEPREHYGIWLDIPK